jgi:hypothetical protein
MRIAGGVVVGYLVIFAIVFVTFSGAFYLLGVERTFQPGSYDVTMIWNIVSVVLGLVAAMVGGVVCLVIARSQTGPRALAALVLLLGLIMAVPVLTGPPAPATRGPEVGNTEAMVQARQPVWAALANPFIGAFGVLLGARLKSE